MSSVLRATDDDAAFAAEGMHWLVDCYGVEAALLANTAAIQALLCEAAIAAGARILFRHFHRFGLERPGAAVSGGVTGVVLLAESHITIHTWPEHGFAAIDLFLCGATAPEPAVACIEQGLAPARLVTRQQRRGGDDRRQRP